MKYLFYCGHPAQYLFFRETIRQLNIKGHDSLILIKTKDVLEDLVISDGFNFKNIQHKERGRSKFSIALGLLRRNLKMLPVIIQYKPDILIGGDPSISQLGWLLRKKRFTLTEDDYSVIKSLARITFPFAQAIVTPKVNSVGRYGHKKIGYNGYMKLAYLHPKVFTPNNSILAEYSIPPNFAIIRQARLTAHHDFGIKGLSHELVLEIIKKLEEKNITPRLSFENGLSEDLKKYALNIDVCDMHHVLSRATVLISDSQSMSVEAAMLGVPSIRYSSFAGRISVLEELEHKYGLTYGVLEGSEALLLEKLNDVLSIENSKDFFRGKQQKMLSEKINVTDFMVWFIENYPESKEIALREPDFQEKFKVQN